MAGENYGGLRLRAASGLLGLQTGGIEGDAELRLVQSLHRLLALHLGRYRAQVLGGAKHPWEAKHWGIPATLKPTTATPSGRSGCHMGVSKNPDNDTDKGSSQKMAGSWGKTGAEEVALRGPYSK